MIASRLREEKIEISCANAAELRDNGFNIGGLAIWHGIGQMDGKDQLEADPPQRSADRKNSHFRDL
jgi:hypothetical protein